MAVSAAQQAGQFRLYETGPDVMSREAAERQARTAGLCEVCRMREGPLRLPHGVAGRAQDHTVLPVLPVGSRPPAGRAGKTWGSGWARAGRRPASLTLGRHAGGPAHPAAARPDRGTPRAGRRAPVQVLDPLRATGSPVSRDVRGMYTTGMVGTGGRTSSPRPAPPLRLVRRPTAEGRPPGVAHQTA